MKRTSKNQLKNLSLRLEPELFKKAQQTAKHLSTPVSYVLRAALRIGLERAEEQLGLGR